ncbi:MAG: hypothetical protein ACRC20_09710 [Segniliparus sp.]|uniref:hypothetical protein n=1 Tax=Segniliparus sp. TaxID=2804064 RepID=UPI003F312AB7
MTTNTTAARLGDLAGVWRRTLFALGEFRDESTQVWWLQARTLFVDLRLPSGSATPEGFAGQLVQEGDVFEWRRVVDLRPSAGAPDAGLLRFEGETLVETGVHAPYREHWAREGGSEDVWAAELVGGAGERAVVVRVGSRFAFASSAPIGTGLAQIVVGVRADGGWTALEAADPADVGARLALTAGPEHMRSEFRRADGATTARRWKVVHEEGDRAL